MTPSGSRVIVCTDCAVAALRIPESASPASYYWTEKRCPPCLAKLGRVMSAPILARTPARSTGISLKGYTGTTGNDTHAVTGSNGQYVNGVLPGLEDTTTGRIPGIETGGVGELSRRRDNVPESLREFDAILRRHHTDAPTKHHVREYKPYAAFYARVLTKLAAIPGEYNITDAARDMIDWLAVHKDRTKDIVRFAERWLESEADRRNKWGRNGRGPYQQQPKTDAQRYRMGGGLAQTEKPSTDAMTERGRSHYGD